MKYIRKQLDLLTRLALSEDPKQQFKLKEQLREALHKINVPGTVDEVLAELGIPDNQVGKRYLARAIQIQMQYAEPLPCKKMLFPMLAAEFKVSAMSIEKGCRNSIEAAFERIDPDVAEKYFGGTIDPDRGKPVLRHFVTRIANLLREDA